MRFSASRLDIWMRCPLAAHYRYSGTHAGPMHAKAFFGQCMHAGAQYFYESHGDVDGAIDLFRDRWRQAQSLDLRWRPLNEPALRKKGAEIFKKLGASNPFRTWTVLGAEVPFLVPFGDHELTGIIDLLVVERSGTGRELLKIVDHKTNTKDPTIAELALNQQMTVYHYAVGHKQFWTGVEGSDEFTGIDNGEWEWAVAGSQLPRRCIWHSLWNGKEIDAGPRDEEDYARLYRVCDEIEVAESLGVYVPKIGEACQWCDFKDPCAYEIPIAIEKLSDPNDPNRWI